MRSHDLFGYMENGKFLIGWKHRYMTKLERERAPKWMDESKN